MAWEKFTQVGRSYVTRLSVRSNGQLGFSQGAIHKFKLAAYKHAILFFDKDQALIGVKLTNEDGEQGIAKLQVRAENASISAKAFLDYYGINYQKTRSYSLVNDEDSGMLIADLNKPA